MATTAGGTLIIIQQYYELAPTLLAPIILQQVTKNSIDYGYKMKQHNSIRQIMSGDRLHGLKATLTYNEQELLWEVMAYGGKDWGVLIITQISKNASTADQELLSLLWQSLKIAP